MISRKIIPFIYLFLFVCAPDSWSQEESPSTTKEPAKDNVLSKVSFVRIWYIGDAKSPRITICGDSRGNQPQVLGSSMRSGRLGSYQLFKPGKLSILVYNGSAIPNESGKLESPGEPLATLDQIDLKGGGFYTIIARETAGKFSLESKNDAPPEKDMGPIFHVYDFSKLPSGGVVLASGNKKQAIWTTTTPTPFSKNLPGTQGPARLELHAVVNQNSVCTNAYETEISPLSSYSIVVFFDRYNQRVFGVTEDAKFDASEQDIKDFLKDNK